MDTYPIYFAQQSVGTANVTQEGLYYRIQCKCELMEKNPFCVLACGSDVADLGVCVPMDDACGMEVRIPVKRIGRGNLQFKAVLKHSHGAEPVIVLTEEPFDSIAKLKDAYLIKRGDFIGISYRITNRSPGQQDSGQNP